MNKLLEKIRKILSDRRIRRKIKFVVSIISAIIVFVSTYALILPAITEEKIAACGIEEHQHTDDCYTEELICDIPESEGHEHTDSCFTVKRVLSCDASEHVHDENCYDENGELICTVDEHVHDDQCYREVKELTCGTEESEGHTHGASCYEKKLTCGKEVHVHSVDCYEMDENSASQSEAGKDSDSAAPNDVLDDASDGALDETSDRISARPLDDASDGASASSLDGAPDAEPDGAGNGSFEGDADSLQNASADNNASERDYLNMETMLNDHTDVYYYHAQDGEEIPADSAEITDWARVKKDTVLASTDLVKLYFAYTIPAGRLNETNPVAKYRLPKNIHLTERQIEEINKNRNRLAAGYGKSSAEYRKYLGVEAKEGTRKPDKQRRDGAEEPISAVVRVEKTAGGGQELVFIFTPYSVEKNQKTYSADGDVTSAGETITGWFAYDFSLSQIDWVEKEAGPQPEQEDAEVAEAVSSAEDTAERTGERTGEGTGKDSTATTVITVEKTADIIFVPENKDKDIEEIRTTLRLFEQIEKQKKEDDAADSLEESVKDPKEETGQEGQESGDGAETAEGDGNKSPLKKREQSETRLTGSQRSSSNESSDLRDFLTRVAVSGASIIDGNYVVQQGQTYSVTMTFKETPQVQFENDATLVYRMPDGVILPTDTTTPIRIAIVANGRTYEISGTVTADTDGIISVRFDETDPNFVYLEDATNVGFRVTVNAQFTADISKTEWSAMAERDIILDTTDVSDAYVTKSGVFDEQTGKFTFTVRVTANGTPENVNVMDLITGDALIFNDDVTITGNSSEPVTNSSGNGFDYTFPTMQDGEEITITYTASVNPEKASNGTITADQTRNTVTVQKEDGEPHTAEYTHSIDLVSLNKGDGAVSDETPDGPDGSQLYSWRIDYNTLALVSVAGDTITDTIAPASQEYMTYYGDVTVKFLDSSGTLIGTDTVTPGNSSWNYVIPDTHTEAYHYVFEYQTVVDQAKVDQTGQSLPLINTVTGGGKTDTGTINVSPVEETTITKAVESSSPQEVAWVSRIHVPESGLSAAVVTDTLPVISAHQIGLGATNYTSLYDAYKKGTLQITGLLQGESYDVNDNGDDKVVITFYKDSGKTQPGLQSNPGGHDITIRLTTEVNQDWLQYGYDHPGTWQASHRNTIDINTNTIAYADVTFAEAGFTKTGLDQTGAMDKKHYLYTLVLSNVSESPIIIEDTFDTSLLEVATDLSGNGWYFKIWGGDQYDQSYGETSVNYSDTSTGIRITANDVPLQENGEYYPYYRIRYYLRLKDGINLDDLAIENGGKFDLTNTAAWGDHTSSYTFTTVYDFLDKELLKAATDEDRQVQYSITYNPAIAELNGGQDLVMTDTLNKNLSIDYTSIVITTDPEGQAVPYELVGDSDPDNEGGTIARYTIPDSTKVVITYDAMVVGTGLINYKNVVEANGMKETVEETVTIDISGEGQGATADLKVVKVDGYDASRKLPGVQFRLYSADLTETEEHYDLSLDNSGVYEMVLETDENGVLAIDGTKIKIYLGVKYYLEEVAPPDGYQSISFPYQFTLVDNMDLVDYTGFSYFYRDSFQIKNWPLEGLVVEKRVESSDESDYTKDFSFEVSILTEDGNVDTGVNETYGDMTFVNGVAAFTLKNGQQLSANNMPQGTKFRVHEMDADGFTVSTTVGETTEERTFYTGVTSVDYTLVTFTNTKKENPSGYVLPNTGGPGTGLFMILGSIAIAGAGLLLWRSRRTI